MKLRCALMLATAAVLPITAPAALTVSTLTATNIGRTNAVLNASLVSTNGTGTGAVVSIYYGLSDRGTNAGLWSASTSAYRSDTGTLSLAVASLTPARLYWCRASATELQATNTTVWGNATSFWTATAAPTGYPSSGTNGIAVMVGPDGRVITPSGFWASNAPDITGATTVTNELDPKWASVSNDVLTMLELMGLDYVLGVDEPTSRVTSKRVLFGTNIATWTEGAYLTFDGQDPAYTGTWVMWLNGKAINGATGPGDPGYTGGMYVDINNGTPVGPGSTKYAIYVQSGVVMLEGVDVNQALEDASAHIGADFTVSNSTAHGITTADVASWNAATNGLWSTVSNSVMTQAASGATAAAWGDHSTNGYIRSSYTRYMARSTSGGEIWVCASKTGVTATVVGSGITVNNPVNAIIQSMTVRWNGQTLGTTFTVNMGTNDWANSSASNRGKPVKAVYREDGGSWTEVQTASISFNPSTYTEFTIGNLISTCINSVELRW